MAAEHPVIDLISETATLSVEMRGGGKPLLLLRSGAGPSSLAPLADGVASRYRVIMSFMPGFDDQPRPLWVRTISDVRAGSPTCWEPTPQILERPR